jgi:hypothetical protein
VDIIQAVGRAIRLSPDKKAGTIVLPVFIKAGENAIGTIEASNFKPVWDVLNALKAHDDVLACELDQLRTDLGRKPGSGVSEDELGKIAVELPIHVEKSIGGVLRTYLVERATESWNFWFGLLEAFVEREGHAKVPRDYRTDDGYWLGNWVGRQRTEKDKLSPERQVRLGALPGWSWNTIEDQWEEGLRYLREFANREGHAKVPYKHTTSDGFLLGGWVRSQRSKRDGMSAERRSRLEALPGWVWAADNQYQWEESFEFLQKFVEQNGHARVPLTYQTIEGFPLGAWISRQRAVADDVSNERRLRLEALPGWSWDANDAKWEEGFRHLKEFADCEGHAYVPTKFMATDGYPLGRWITEQRSRMDELSPDRKGRLESLSGWSWNANDAKWEEGFRHLKDFVDRVGHVSVPKDRITADGYRLGQWVNTQRREKASMSSDRKMRFEALAGAYDIEEWFAECIIRDSAARIKRSDLKKSYAEFVKALGGFVGNFHLGPELIKRGLDQRKSNGVLYVYGCRLKGSADVGQRSSWDDMPPEPKAPERKVLLDVIDDWLAECIIRDSAARIKQSDLVKSYAEFVKALGGFVGKPHLGPELIKRGLDQRRSNGVRYVYGCRLRGPEDAGQQ